MSWAISHEWDTRRAREIAGAISSIPSLYCGPAAVGWIAAVWNDLKGRPYDFSKRLRDKDLFQDGPRPFRGYIPGFQLSLSDTLKRETNGELALSAETFFSYRAVHETIETFNMPVMIRMPAPRLRDVLHYVTLYRSELRHDAGQIDCVQFYWQDNGLYGGPANKTGLNNTGWRSAGYNFFLWGAKRVVAAG